MLEAQKKMETVGDFLRFTVSTLSKSRCVYGHGTDNANDEGYLLVSSALKIPNDKVPYYLNAKILDEEKSEIIDLLHVSIHSLLDIPPLSAILEASSALRLTLSLRSALRPEHRCPTC